jgi:pimeloyl-ACP methyl ester carboxylesterase
MSIFALTMSAKIDIVLMHGWGCDQAIWRGVKASLEAAGGDNGGDGGNNGGDGGNNGVNGGAGGGRYRVTAVDFPGFGNEPEPPTPWGMEDYTAWFEDFLASRGIENPVLVGHSFGGRVALIFASRNPVSKVVLVDAAGVKPRRSARYYIKVWSFKALKGLAPLLLGRAKADAMIERRRARAGSADYNAASPVMRGTLSRVVNEDLRRFMPKISAPTLLVWGSEDTATPLRDAKIMERLIPDAGLVTFDGAGHYSFLDRPAQFISVLDSFLRS